MRAVAHGWKPSKGKAPPVDVAREFVDADKEADKFTEDVKRRNAKHRKRRKR